MYIYFFAITPAVGAASVFSTLKNLETLLPIQKAKLVCIDFPLSKYGCADTVDNILQIRSWPSIYRFEGSLAH